MSTIIFQIQSTLILSLLLYGVYHKKNRFKHVKIMKTAIVWDLLLIAQIELTRGAIATASAPLKNSNILNFHISIAVLTVILYAVMFKTGKKLLSGKDSIRPIHKTLGILTLTCRITTFITSFVVL